MMAESGRSAGVLLFAPLPVLTVTIEDHAGVPDIHLHAGGQGVWQARMLITLGVPVTMCAVLGGESGRVLRTLLESERIDVRAVAGTGRNGAYVHDRRGGDRVEIAEAPAEPLSRHELDHLYSLTLGAAVDAGAVVLSGPADDQSIPADVYRRLAADLKTIGRPVIADLAGERLTAVLAGGLNVAKVSHEELQADGRVADTEPETLVRAMHELREQGAAHVIVTRAADPFLVLSDGTAREVHLPRLKPADTHGAGDSLTAGVAAALARGESIDEAVRLGAAAGMVNVTRHGLGTGDAEAVLKLRELVGIHAMEASGRRLNRVSPDELASRVKEG